MGDQKPKSPDQKKKEPLLPDKKYRRIVERKNDQKNTASKRSLGTLSHAKL